MNQMQNVNTAGSVALQPKVSQTDSAVGELGADVEYLRTRVQLLGTRLEPVILDRSGGDAAKSNGVPEPVRCSLAQRVVDQSRIVRQITAQIEEYLTNLEV